MANKKIIEFDFDDDSLPPIKSAKNYIPDWYKNIKAVNNKNMIFDSDNYPALNIKSCMPFLDTLTSGYTISLWCDIHVELLPNGEHYVRWGSAAPSPINIRTSSINPIPKPIGCEPSQYIWLLPYYFRAPKEYSLLITHPLNRYDLPFITLSGIVETHRTLQKGKLPFFFKEGYEGVIEQGTPIAQIIPVKNDSWKIKNNNELRIDGETVRRKSNRIFGGLYKKDIWTRKDYE